MRQMLLALAITALVAGCSTGEPVQAQKDDPAGAIYGHGMIGTPKIVVPGRSTTVY